MPFHRLVHAGVLALVEGCGFEIEAAETGLVRWLADSIERRLDSKPRTAP